MDWKKLAEPLSGDSPCGEDPYEESYEFGPLIDLVRDDGSGAVGIDRKEPDWGEVLKTCESIFATGKHLQVVVIYTYASLMRRGIRGLVAGLSLIAALVKEYWSDVHPLLDPDDDDDPLERLNILGEIAAPIGSSVGFIRFLKTLEDVPLFQAPRLGRAISLLDVRRAKGEVEAPEDVTVLGLNVVQGAFGDADTEEVASMLEALASGLELVREINSSLQTQTATGDSIYAQPLLDVLELMQATVLELQGGGSVAIETSGAGQAASSTAVAQGAAPAVGVGEIRSRQDVREAIDKICKWYTTNEPSSPVPLILERGRSLIGMDFRAIVKQLASSSEHEVAAVIGPDPDEESY